MRDDAGLVRDLQPAEPDMVALPERMNVEPGPDPDDERILRARQAALGFLEVGRGA
jgi:hypothetical protein